MEDNHVKGLMEYLLSTRFRTKRCMADAMDVPYRMLLRVFASTGSSNDCRSVLDAALRYAVRNRIHLEDALINA